MFPRREKLGLLYIESISRQQTDVLITTATTMMINNDDDDDDDDDVMIMMIIMTTMFMMMMMITVMMMMMIIMTTTTTMMLFFCSLFSQYENINCIILVPFFPRANQIRFLLKTRSLFLVLTHKWSFVRVITSCI